ncbi:MAG: fibronectin type III domain-containing protein, partial [Bdellovibrionales bacterium]|nr:fibronectin type III domain-containing protein [Bdellovibrionales bacterium]
MKLERALSNIKIVAILSSLIFTACLREQKEAPLAQRSGYVGCLDAVATGKDSIEVSVNMPSQATEVQIFRNNTLVGSVFPGDSQNNIFNDTLLPVQGEVYKYSCKAITPNEDLVGYNEPTVRTTPEDAPIFEGLKTVSIENNVHAKLTWKSPASSGPKVIKYEVYANMNRATGSMTPNVDFSKDPVATVTAPATEYTVTEGLGDKIPYVFSVLACTHNDICAGSDIYKTASTLDNGKPETPGISNIETLSGGIKVTAPWDESMGETTKRVLYMGTSNSTNLADYTQIRAFNISSSDLKNESYMQGMTTFEVVDSRIQENTLYYFALVDQDSNSNTSTVIRYELQTYDLTPPNFIGITDISPNSLQPATAMDITFPASNTEGAPDNDPTGASSYVVEYTQTPYIDGSTTWPADPCTEGTRYSSSFTANPGGVAGGTSVTITVNGLSPRTYYRFCVRAKDAYGNESGDLSTSVTIPVATLDSAPPVFDGIQGLSGVTPDGVYHIKVDWNKASDLHSNVKYYQLKLWSNTADSSAASDLKTINRNASNSDFDNGTLIANGTDFDYGQGTRVYVLVNACDDADNIPDGSMNCTNYDDSLAMSIIPPDIEPPQNFTGISDATSTVSNGVATLSWYEPTPWSSDYFGFRIYNSVYNSSTSKYDLTLLKSCNCASPGNCVSPTDLSCDVGNLDPNREYRFHVRAVDAAGNETQTNPQVSWEAVTIKDGNPPTFTPNLAGDWSVADQAIKLNWSAATDNQYTGDLRYEIF